MKNKFNKVLSDFSSVEKVLLYNFLYEELSGKGICGDTELAHVNKHEMAVLRSMGGVGTINENTKCVQFFGSPPPPPPVQTVSRQTSEIPEELKPYVKEVLSEAQDIYRTRKEEGYVPYTGQEIAEFSPEQERAFDLTSQAVGQTQAFATPAAQFAGLAGLGTTDADISRFMNPYVSQVIERAERERRRAADIEQQELAARAVQAGAFGGSREAILEAERRRNLEQGIADIRTAGLSEAFKQAVQQAQAQQENRLGAARSLTELAQVAPRGTADELARLEAVGAARRGRSQADLDISQRKFLEERTFPEATLAQYSEFIQPTQRQLGAAGTRTNIGPGQAQPTYLQQASGFLGALSKFRKTGGKVGGSSGLASLQAGGQIPDPEDDPDKFTKEEEAALAAVLAEAQPGFFETARDTVSSGISSIRDFFTERPKQDPFATPTRLDTLGDFLIGYSQADPSKPLGTQFGQAAASMSAKQAKERQQRLANEIARRRLGLEKRELDIKAAKVGRVTNSELRKLITTFNDGTVSPEAKKEIAALYPNDPRVQKQYRIAMGKTLSDKPGSLPPATGNQNNVPIIDKSRLGQRSREQLNKRGRPKG
tara:strand:+ start:8515 stop:10311 length:1797 start_codon:yes stop_codon:yes gene_type:complete